MCGDDGFLKQYEDSFLFYKRSLDDIIGIWLAHPDSAANAKLWQEFQDVINDLYRLERELLLSQQSRCDFYAC